MWIFTRAWLPSSVAGATGDARWTSQPRSSFHLTRLERVTTRVAIYLKGIHMPTASEITNLKAIVKRGLRAPDASFDENQAVTVPEGNGDHYWRSLRVNLVAYAYGEGDEGSDDEPEFITAATADGSNSLIHEPQVADPPERERDMRVLANRTVLLHQSLDDRQVHEFFVSSAAFDSDSDSAWSGVVQGLRNDLRSVGSAAIASSLLAGFQTPAALMNFVIQHAGDAATDDPEQIGSQEVVLDLRKKFQRPADKEAWTIHKWTLFSRPGQAAWYLALWRIELDARAGALSHAGLDTRDNATDVGRLMQSMEVTPTELAAVRTLQGQPVATVARELRLTKAGVVLARRAFMDQEADVIHRRLAMVGLHETALLRAATPAVDPG